MVEGATRKRRLFVGVELADRARNACAAASEELRKIGFAAKYEAPEKLHVTIAFLGYVEALRYEAVAGALFAAAERVAPFSLELDKLGAFPHERRPRIVYIGARDQGSFFHNLSELVRNAYTELGFEFKNDSVAHVTIARVKAPNRPLPLIEFAPIPFRIERLTLFESRPDKANNTSRYESMEIARLSS